MKNLAEHVRLGRNPTGRSALVFLAAMVPALFALVLLVLSPNGAQSELAVFLVLFLMAAAAAISFTEDDILSPYYAALLLYSLYSCSAVAGVVINAPGTYSALVLRTYYLSVLIGLVGLIAGYKFIARARFGFAHRLMDRKISLDRRRFGIAIGAVALIAISLQAGRIQAFFSGGVIRPYTSWALENTVNFREDSWSGILSYAQGLTAMLLFGGAFFFLLQKRSLLIRVLVVTGVALYLVMTVMMGQKRGLFCGSFLALLYYHYRVRGIRPVTLLVPTLFLYLFGVMINNVRFTTSIPEMVAVGVSMVRENPKIMLPINAGELNGPPVTLLDIVEAEDRGEMRISWGSTVISELMVWIPRAFYPNRPLPLSEEYMRIFFPDEYARGAGHGFFIPTEGYWAFGIPGVFMAMFAYGALIAAIYRVFKSNYHSDVVLLIYGLAIFTLVFTGIRTGLIGTIRATIMDTAPFILLAFVFARNQRKDDLLRWKGV